MPPVATTMPCPTDDTLGAMVERALGDLEAAQVASHLDGCAECQQIVIAAIRGGARAPRITPATAVGTPSVPSLFRPTSALAIGSRIGRYQVRALLGAGGMGQVYDAYDAELDRSIALKVLRPELVGTTAMLADRLVNESRVMAKLAHPSVIAVYDAGREGEAVFIAMELVRGQTLAAHLARTKPGWREIVGLFERAGQGLAAAHAASVVHRDFKPDNVLVELDGASVKRVIVTDFGIARTNPFADDVVTTPRGGAPSQDVRLTAPGTAIGTPAYMSPEQLAGQPVDRRSDVFAFSVSLWEALFGARPFTGNTVEDIRIAVRTPPRAPRTTLPGRLIRALERGLAFEPAQRWPDMPAMLAELSSVRSRRRRLVITAAAIGLVAVGIAATEVARPGQIDPCARDMERTARIVDPRRIDAVRAALGPDPRARDYVMTKLETVGAAWRTTHLATCHPDRSPVQAATTTACLDARRLELSSFIVDVLADGPANAVPLTGILGDPARCLAPAPGLVLARVPEDPMLQRQVTAIRYRAFAAEAARDRADFKAALASEIEMVADAAITWPPLHAETLYLLGTTQSQGSDTKQAIATFRAAAALAESVHHDYVAANSWIQLAQTTTFDDGDPKRGLEYITYAEAADDRLGHPANVATILQYVKGTTLIEADRSKEAEVCLRRAVELAETSMPDYLPQAIQGLGYLYEDQGRYGAAVDAYRKALASLPKTGAGVPSSAVIFRERLAINLSILGKTAEAEAMAREGVTLADATLGTDNIDRSIAHLDLAQVLQDAGQYTKALDEVQPALRAIAAIQGERSERYGEALSLEGSLLGDLDRFEEAVPRFARACEIVAFAAGDGSSQQAECWLKQAMALDRRGREAEALALTEKVLPALITAYGESHPEVANAYLERGLMHAGLAHHDAAQRDLERAVAMFEEQSIATGHLGAARWALAKELWPRDPVRARSLIVAAFANLDHAAAPWHKTREEVAAWLATNGHVTDGIKPM